MSLKYDFNISQGNNLFLDALIYGNTASGGLLVYVIVLFISLVILIVSNIFMEDFNLSLLYSLYVGSIMGVILYYMGLSVGSPLFSGRILVGLLLIVAGYTGALVYSRNKLGGD